MSSYKHTRRHHGIHKTRRLTERLINNTLRKSRGRVMKGGMKVKYKNGVKYDGDIKRGMANGKGAMTWGDGAVYVGEFKDDKNHGVGKMTWADGTVYEGESKHGVKHGKGKYTWTTGEVYEGDYRNDMKHGKGVYKWNDGRVYDGNWENNNMKTLTLLLQDGDVSNIAFHPSEPLLLSLCRSKNPREPQRLFLQRFDRNRGGNHSVLDQKDITESLTDSPVRSIEFHPKAPIFVVGDGNGDLHLFKWEIDLSEGLSEGLSVLKTSATKIDPRNIVFRRQCELIAFHPYEPLLATCGESYSGISTVRLWRIKRVKSTNSFELEDLQCEIMAVNVSSIAFHPTQPILITACGSRLPRFTENTVKLWNYFDYNPSGVSPNLMTILSTLPSVENDIRTAFNSDHTSFHSDFVTCVAFHPTQPLFITGSQDTTIKMWRMTPKPLENGQGLWQQLMNATCVTTFRPEVQSPVTSVAFHPTAPLLVGGYNNGNAILWSYIGFLTNKVLTIDPKMYEEYGLTIFPPPPPPPVSLRSVTPWMLTSMKSKLHSASSDRGKDDMSRAAAAMMNSSSRVPVPMAAASLEFDHSPPPAQRLTRAQRGRNRREGQERRANREVSVSGVTSVTSVNFQVDSSKVTFLEIGRSNTNIVELQNVGHFVSAAEYTARERNEHFETRGELVQALSGKFMPPGMLPPSPRKGSGRFTGKEFEDAMRRLPVRPRGGVTVDHDNDWRDTQESRSQQGPPLQGELDSETREAIQTREESDRWRERVQEAKRLQEIKLQRERERELLSQPLQQLQPQPQQPLASPPSEGGKTRRTTRKYRRNK